jgi:hypothetical protein
MTRLAEGLLVHEFPPGWRAWKCDSAPYYQRHFNSFAGGAKSVDFAAIEPAAEPVLWLVEIKDYRATPRSNPSDLFSDVAMKVRDTLACLIVTACNSMATADADNAREACKVARIRVVLHLEQPVKPSKLFPQVIDPKTAKDKLKQQLRAIDPHPVWGNSADLVEKVAWRVG